ncbi:unnamed protein product [Moneuplotes crassus]|uniref:Short-chain dehydrogenase/reductase 3 n=1 Tax=Euplotes crassus TaxID=5936 RepID=A0AAD1XKD9_EUPCR|nr:unnamed protein product [Moneuplotes crassus]
MEKSGFTKILDVIRGTQVKDIPGLIWKFHQRFGILKTLAILYILAGFTFLWLKANGLWFKKSIRGKHVFITGGGSGLGRDMALILAKKGAKVSVSDINLESAQETVEMVKSSKGKAHAVALDVTNPEDITKAHESAKEQFGVVDILINNAGITFGRSIVNSTPREIDLVYKVNAISHAYIAKQFLPDMIKQDSGHVVTISSAASTVGVANNADYAASKWACFGYDESLRSELRKMGSKVKTTCICPYYINTGMFEGVKSKCPILLPFLDQNWTTRRIINSILQEEPVTYMPFMVNLNGLLRAILPTCLFDSVQDLVGTSSGMDTFVGRK